MQKHKTALRVSVVIPVYNEEGSISTCLDAIAAQTVKPFEVIVIDNNSSDDTAAIAKSYWFVKLIREPRQGVVYARDTGFSYAHGDIIGRIDADTVMSENWVETLLQIFACKSVDAVTGSARYYDVSLARLGNWIDLGLRRYLARRLGRHVGLQGANMAMRRSVWNAVKKQVCNVKGIHEDLDLGVHTSELGFRNVFDERLVVSLGFRQSRSPFVDYYTYLMQNPRTYSLHGLNIQRHMYPVIAFALVMFWPIKLAYRGFDPKSGRFSFAQLLEVPEQEARVNPALFVD